MLDLLVFPQAKKIIRFSSHWILIFSFDSLTAPSKLEGPGAMGGRGRYQFLEVDWVNFDDMEWSPTSPQKLNGLDGLGLQICTSVYGSL